MNKHQEKKTKESIMVIEDDKILSKTICSFLEFGGHQCMPAMHAMEAYALLEKKLPDLILLDLLLPKIHGFEVLKKLKQDPKTKGIPIIIFTNLSQDADRRTGMQLGADAYVVKASIDRQAFYEIICEHLKKKEEKNGKKKTK